jgi:DNA-3-methyladenine glycosylase
MRHRGELMTTNLQGFFSRPSPEVARDLIGAQFLVDGVGGVIVETEAYDSSEPASHTYGGPTPRNRAMFGPAASVYIYRSYGLHWCLNFVCLPASAVLIRALEPRAGIDTMQRRRGLVDVKRLCSGPGRLTQALAIDIALDGLSLEAPPFQLTVGDAPTAISVGTRIGITRAAELPWRFGLRSSAYLSKRFDAPAKS